MLNKLKSNRKQKLLNLLIFAAMSLFVLYIAVVIVVSSILSKGIEYKGIKISAHSVMIIPPFYVGLNGVKIESPQASANFRRVSLFSFLPSKTIDFVSLNNGTTTVRVPQNVPFSPSSLLSPLSYTLPLGLFAERVKLNNVNIELEHPEYSFSISELKAGVSGLNMLRTNDFSSNVYVSKGNIVFKNEYVSIETALSVDGKIKRSSDDFFVNTEILFSPFSSNFAAAQLNYDALSFESSFEFVDSALAIEIRPVLRGLSINGHKIESLDFVKNDLVISAQTENVFTPNSFKGKIHHLKKEIANLNIELNPEKTTASVAVTFSPFNFEAENDFLAFLTSIDDLRAKHLKLSFASLSANTTISPEKITLKDIKTSFSAKCNISLLNEFRVSGFNVNASSNELNFDYKTFGIEGELDINGSASAGFIPLNITADQADFYGTLSFNNSLWPKISSRAKVEYENNLIRSNAEFHYRKNEFRSIRHFLRNQEARVRIRPSRNLGNIFRRRS